DLRRLSGRLRPGGAGGGREQRTGRHDPLRPGADPRRGDAGHRQRRGAGRGLAGALDLRGGLRQDYRVILPSACYSYDEATGLYSDLRQTDAWLQYLYDNALRLQVTGIIRKNPDVDTGMLSGKICYTSGLIDYMVEQAE